MVDEPIKTKQSAPPPPDTTGPGPASATAQPREKIEAKRMGVDPTRPVRYGAAFVGGTIKGGLDGMARGGRLGFRLGMIAHVASWFLVAGVAVTGAPALSAFIAGTFLWGILGFAGGAALSGSLGLLAGGARGVGRAQRKEKYADELAVKQHARASRRGHGLDYEDRYDLHRKASSYNFDRLMQQDTRTSSDVSTYWQDRVSSGDRGSGRGM